MIPRLFTIAVGLWLMAAPAVLGYGGIASDHDRIVGPMLASFGCVALWEATRPLRWMNLVIGAWMLAAPWLLGFAWPATLNTTLCALVAGGAAIVRGRIQHRFGGGWRELWQPERENVGSR